MEPNKRSLFSPWGVGGCLWRTLIFLLGMVFICWILSLLLKRCNPEEDENNRAIPIENRDNYPYGIDPVTGKPYDRDGQVIDDDYDDPYREYRDPTPVREWIDSIPGVAELPAPRDNYIPPIDETRIITNPTDSTSLIVQDELIVLFNSDDVKGDMAKFAKRFKELYPGRGYEVSYYNPMAGTMLLKVPEDQLIKVAEELNQKIPDINFIVTTNEIMNENEKPSDPGFKAAPVNEYFDLIQAYDAWDITKGSKDIKVAIVDSYFDLTNPEIGERYVNPIHIPTKTADVLPPAKKVTTEEEFTPFVHGSHVAGIAIGGQNNGKGASGIAPEVTWIPVSLGDQLSNFNIIEGILYAIYQGADVVNFSIGKSFPKNMNKMPLEDQVEIALNQSKSLQALWKQVVKIANDHNCVLVTSAGNETVLMGLDPKNRNDGIIKVEAVDGKGIMANFSNYGKVPEADLYYSTVAAPGVDIWSVGVPQAADFARKEGYVVSSDNHFQNLSGTSMAAPIVAGAVALLKSKNKNLTTEDVIKILTATAKQTDNEHRIGPTIQIKDALDMVGGDLLNFDELMKDHNLIIGTWKSTYEQIITSGETGEKLDDIWIYFTFTSTSSGYAEYRCINSRKVYKTNLAVEWGKDSLKIKELGKATTSDGDALTRNDFICKSNKEHLLEATCYRDGQAQFDFMLEKVK